jgi:hypothetical protein
MKTLKNKLGLKIKSTVIVILFALLSCNQNASNAQVQNEESNKNIKIALLLDTSNSMDGLIEQAKSQLWQLVNELAKAECDGQAPNLAIALYEYGNDNLSAREGYIKQVTALTSDLDQLSEDLFGLTTNGGSEYCGQVIQTAINQQDWSVSSGDLQIIFIAGNEEFTQGNVDYKTACALAKEKNIIVNTIHCGGWQEGIEGKWKHGAEMADGQYMCIEQDRKTVYIESPYDDKIAELNSQLNETYIGYGNKGKAKKEAQVQQDMNAASYSKANEVKRAVSKSSHFYKNSKWDLVDAAEEDSFEMEAIAEEELPVELQGKTVVEKEQYIAEKAEERKVIQSEIKALNKQRQSFVAEKQQEAGEEAMLDQVMIKAIKSQASTKEFKFEE